MLRPPIALRASACALAVLLAAAADAGATPLLSRARGTAALQQVETPGIARAQPLRLDRGALATLRTRQQATVDGFPLGRDRTVTLALARFDPFPPHARVEVVEDGGTRELPLPDIAYFRGTVAGEPASRVLLLAAPDGVHGFVASRGDVFPFGRRSGMHVSYALQNANPAFFPPPGDFCSNDLHPEQVTAPAPRRIAGLPPPVAGLPLKVADVAVETDQELRAKFGSDQAALDYLAALLAAMTTIYERDVSVRLTFSYIRLWNTTDPWTATGTSGALSELLSYWNANMASQPRDVAHMISGKSVQGGIAYLDVLCNTSWAYGVSQVYGSFDLANPNNIWDVEVVAHELGHNFGSPHTHCYNPPVDKCYNGEAGCWSGAIVPTSDGTIMSYCHLNAGGLSNIDLVLGDTVSTRIGTSVAAASCLSTVTTTSTSATSTSSTSVTSTSSTSVTSTTGTTSTSTSVTSTTSTTATSTTTSSATSTSSSTTSSVLVPTTSTSSSSTSSSTATTSTTSTTVVVPRSGGDADGDGVSDAADACADTPAGDLVGATGCSVCPCDGGVSGWASRRGYLACVRGETRLRVAARAMDASARRGAMKRARLSSCARPSRTRCCLPSGTCAVVSERACTARGGDDVGAGSCLPSPCD